MPLSRSRDYLSIGEVLETIRQEFPDVSISKIRFLENEGLIAPERTESGYRKFYDGDVRRLRYILALQRDLFLPLRVIKKRLEVDGDQEDLPPAAVVRDETRRVAEDRSSAPVEELQELSLDREGLRNVCGLSEQELAGLEDYGILGRRDGSYNATDVALAKAAKSLFRFGFEPRHMRMFKQTVDRERAMVEQIVAPILRKRDPEARSQASVVAKEIVEQARRLRDAMLRSSLKELL